MGEVMQGKDRILLVRRLDEAATKKARSEERRVGKEC